MGDARRAYEHYRWAERYSRYGRNDKAGAHMRRALHYGHSGFGGVKRPLDTGDAGDGSYRQLTTQAALVEAYQRSEPVSRLGFLSSLCSTEFRRFFYDKPSGYNRISETQKALFKARIAELRIGDQRESGSIARCLTALVDSLRLVPFSEFCVALAHCTVELCTKAHEAMQARQARQAVRKVKLLVAVSNVGVPDELDTDQTKKSNEWIPLLLFTMLIAAMEPNSKVREFMADSYPEALGVLDNSRSELFFPHDVALYHENDLRSPLHMLVQEGDLLVVCDDASYTGKQVTQNARGIRRRGVAAPMIVVLPFASAEALRKLGEVEGVSVVTKGRIEVFGDLDGTKCEEIMKRHSKPLYSVMWYKATTGFQHKIADYLSFYPHLLLGSLDEKTYLLPDEENRTLLADCAGKDPVGRYDNRMADSCLFAFYKNTMAGMDYTGYLEPARISPSQGLEDP